MTLRLLATVLGVSVAIFAAALAAGGWYFSAPRWRGPPSDHFDGAQFHNQVRTRAAQFWKAIPWWFTRERGAWPDWIDAPPGPPPPRRVGAGEMRVTFINHATVLVQMDGVNVLTDPVWSERASPLPFAGPRRVRPAGIRFEDLPPIDVVLISHNHYDHLNVATLQRLAKEHRPRIFTGLGVAEFLAGKGIPGATQLDWWQSEKLPAGPRAAEGVPVPLLEIVNVPAQHFSARGLFDRDATLWCGYVLRGPSGVAYFAGDTGAGPHFDEIRRKFGAPRLALLPIGAYLPEWLMKPVHTSPPEALAAHTALGAGTSVAIHFGTFELSDEGEKEPVESLERALAAAATPRPRFWVLGFGEGRDVPDGGGPASPGDGRRPKAGASERNDDERALDPAALRR